MKTIKFNDFMARKHEIVGLTLQEQHIGDTVKYLLYILVACLLISTPIVTFVPFGGAVIDAFLM